MSFLDKRLSGILFRGGGPRTAPDGAIPVLFGTRFIQNPRIVWMRTRGLPGITGDLAQDNRSFVLLAGLCHGVIDDLHGVWCNGVRVSSPEISFLANSPNFKLGRFKDSRFFSDQFELSGFCAASIGSANELDLFDKAPYIAGNALLKPSNVVSQYRGIAMVHLYVAQQNSGSLNNWSFLTKRMGKDGWQDTLREIEIARQKTVIDLGGEFRARHIVLAVDCSPINGLPVQEASDTTADAGIAPNALNLSEGFNPVPQGPPLRIPTGRFKYRYDIIREQVLATLDKFKLELRRSESGISYDWSLEIVLISAGYHPLEFRGSRVGSGGDYSYTPGKHDTVQAVTFEFIDGEGTVRSGSSRYTLRSNARVSVDNYIEALKRAVQRHDWLRAAVDSDLPYSGYLSLSNSGSRKQRDFALTDNFIQALINPFYHPEGSRYDQIVFHQYRGSRYSGSRLRMAYTPCDWGLAINYAKDNHPHFQLQTDEVLPQISFITGPAWPYTIESIPIFTHFHGTTIYAGFPSIKDLFIAGVYDGPRGLGLWEWSYYPRATPIPAINGLLNQMGITAVSEEVQNRDGVLVDKEYIRLDAVGLDGFCWGDIERRSPSVTGGLGTPTSGDKRTHTKWTFLAREDSGTNPSYYGAINRYRRNPSSPSSQYITNRGSFVETFTALWDVYEEMGFVSLAPANLADTLAKGMGAVRSPVTTDIIEEVFHGMNPAHIIRECLLNADWGKGRTLAASDLDDVSFTATAQQLHDEGIGLGMVWSRQTKISEFVDDVLRHIDGVLYESDNKLYLKLLGTPSICNIEIERINDVGVLEKVVRQTNCRNPVTMSQAEMTAADGNPLSENNVKSVSNMKVPREDELINKLTVQYTPYYSTAPVGHEIDNDDLIAKYGVIPKTIKYDGIITPEVAGIIAQRDFLEESAGLITCTITVLPEVAKQFNPADVVRLSWEQLNIETGYFRIMKIDFGDGRNNRVNIDLIQAHPGNVEER